MVEQHAFPVEHPGHGSTRGRHTAVSTRGRHRTVSTRGDAGSLSLMNDPTTAPAAIPEITMTTTLGTSTGDGGMWSIGGSIPDEEEEGKVVFSAPQPPSAHLDFQPTSQDHKEMESLEMVMGLLDKLNNNRSDFASADSMALQKVHSELQNVSEIIRGFLEFSTTLINDEGLDIHVQWN